MTESNKRQLQASAALDFPSVGAQGNAVLTMAARFAQVGDPVLVTGPATLYGGVAAQATLSMATKPTDGDTVTVGSIEYTFLDSFVDAVNNVFTGADLAASQANLVAAINATGGTPGTTHYTSQVANPDASVAAFSGNDMVATALLAGTAGNSLASEETFTDVTDAWDAATFGTTLAGEDSSELSVDGWVSAEDVVSVRVSNASAGAVDPPSGTYTALVWVNP